MASLSSAPPQEHRVHGILLRLAAASCFAFMAAGVKIASLRGMSAIELLFYRNFFSIPMVVAWLALGPGFRSVRTQRPKAHLLRGTLGVTTMGLTFQGLSMVPLAQATAIGFSSPLFATILSAFLLAEHIGPHRWAAILLGLIGVLVVMQPWTATAPPAGLAVSLLAAVGSSAVTVTVRQIGRTESVGATVFWFNLVSLIAAACLLPLVARMPDLGSLGILALVGMAGGAAQLLTTSSLRYAPVATVAPFDYVQLVWAILFGWLIWSATPTVATLIGAALIAGSGLYTLFREHRLHRDLVAATPPEL